MAPVLVELIQQLIRQLRRRALCRCDVGARLVGEVGDLLGRQAQELADEDGRGAGVAGADGVGVGLSFVRGRLAFVAVGRCVDDRALLAAGQDDGLEVEAAEQSFDLAIMFVIIAPAPGSYRGTRRDRRTENVELLNVKLHGRGQLAGGAKQAGVVKVLAEVEVQQADGLPRVGEEPADAASRLMISLAERAEADGVALTGQVGQVGVGLNPVPGGVVGDVVVRLALLIDADEDPPGRVIGVGLHIGGAHAPPGQLFMHPAAQLILPDPADHHAASAPRRSKLMGMHGHIQRRAAQHLPIRKDIEQRLTKADDCELTLHGRAD